MSRVAASTMGVGNEQGDAAAGDPLDDQAVIDRVKQARALLGEVRDRSDVPAIAHAAHQADVLCHGMLWEYGLEETIAPETEEG